MKRRWSVPIVAVAILTCSVAVWADQGAAPDLQDPETASAIPAQIPDEARTTPNPLTNNEANRDHGRKLFESQCVMCHGLAGAGDGKLAARLAMKMPDLTDPAQQGKRTDGELFYIISNGHGRMPAEKRLSEQARWSLVIAIRAMRRR